MRVLFRHAETKSLDSVHVGHIFIEGFDDVICTFHCDLAVQGVQVREFRFLVTASCPLQIRKVDGIRNSKVLER